METRTLLEDIAAVDWGSLPGAYGPSNVEPNDVGRALGDLLAPASTDAWEAAIEVMTSHVCHQGTVYAVTPRVVPFLVRLAEQASPKRARELAELVGILAAYDPAGPVGASIAEHAETIAAWNGPAPALCASGVPAVRGPWLRRRERTSSLGVCDWLALASAPAGELPAWGVDRAERALDRGGAIAIAAAAVLARHGSGRAAARVEDLLGLRARATVERANDLAAFFPLDRLLAPPRASTRPLVSASVLFVGNGLFVVRMPDGRNATVRCDPRGLAKGDTIRLALSGDGVPAVAEWKDRRDGATVRATFDARGLPTPDGRHRAR